MRRLLSVVPASRLTLVIASLGVVTALVAAPSALAARPAGVTLTVCDRDGAAAEFQARMERVAGATRMRMRFGLQVRTPGRRGYRRVAAPGFGVWTTAAPGITRYLYTRRVEGLIGPARYRSVVRFRWEDARGRTLRRTRAVSRGCRQPDTRPNLRVLDIADEPADDPALRRYLVLVANTGRGDAGAFDLQLAVGGMEAAVTSVAGLAAGRERRVALIGPACERGTTVTAVADPGGAVEERSEVDNALTVDCG